jgi:hypothetical protein
MDESKGVKLLKITLLTPICSAVISEIPTIRQEMFLSST